MKKIGKKSIFRGLFSLVLFIFAMIFLYFLIKNNWNVLDAISAMVDFIKSILIKTAEDKTNIPIPNS